MMSLIDVFTRFHFTEFPASTPPFFVFAQLVGGIVSHQYNLTVECHDSRLGLIIARTEPVPITFSYRQEVRDIIIAVPYVTLKHGGVYNVVVLVDGIEVAYQAFDTPGDAENAPNT